jgi:hypothetical protein
MRTSARRLLAGGVAGLLVAGGALLAVGTSTAGADTFNDNFGSPQTFTVPAGVCQVTIAAFGGAGDSGGTTTFASGGRIQADFTVTPGQVLTVVVGENGGDGGEGFNDGGQAPGDGGNGGGSSAVTSGSTLLIVAGGGGGGSANSGNIGGNGEVGLNNLKGQDGTGPTPGTGGTAQGTPNNGGSGTSDGGGGGAGADPGTGGTTVSESSSGGGGGGNFTTSTAGLLAPPGLNSRDGEVTITAAAPGVGCPVTPSTPASAPAAVTVTPRFTG